MDHIPFTTRFSWDALPPNEGNNLIEIKKINPQDPFQEKYQDYFWIKFLIIFWEKIFRKIHNYLEIN